MKFQNCILMNFVTDTWTDKPKAICPFNFFRVGGIIKVIWRQGYGLEAQQTNWRSQGLNTGPQVAK